MPKKTLTVSAFLRFVLIGFVLVTLALSALRDWQIQQTQKARGAGRNFDFQKLFDLEQRGGKTISTQDLEIARQFFQNFLKADGQWSDAQSLTGFCLYHAGKKQEALVAYQQAVERGPEYIAYFYNAGVIYFENEDYAAALEMFRRALATDIKDNMMAFEQSRVFQFLLLKVNPVQPAVPERIRREYALAAHFASICLHKLGDKENAARLKEKSREIENLGPQELQKPSLVIF